jgi:Hypothetical methyltransferase
MSDPACQTGRSASCKFQSWLRSCPSVCLMSVRLRRQVRSRFAAAAAQRERPAVRQTDAQPHSEAALVACLGRLGFSLRRRDASNALFLVLELQKSHAPATAPAPGGAGWPDLKPCTYKKR